MRILLLTSEFPPSFGGGIGMYVEKVARMLSQNHQVTVLVRDEENSVEQWNDQLRIVRFKHCQGKIYQQLGYWTALAYQYHEEVLKLIEQDGVSPDIIEVQDYNALGYYLLQYKYLGHEVLRQIPIVLHLHTPTFELDRINQYSRYKFPNYWIGQMEKFCIRAADAVLSPSQFLADELQSIIPNHPIKVINLPYEDLTISDDEILGKRDFESDTILYFGRTEYRKGIGEALVSFNRLWSDGYPYKLKIIGGDTFFYPKNTMYGQFLKEKYKHRIEEGLLTFCDAIPPQDLVPEILNARGVIIPSLYENYPYTCLQSMWYGAPMIVSKSGGQSEMVAENGVNGFIFNWDEPGDLEEKLCEFGKLDVSDLKDMSQNAFQRIRHLCHVEKNARLREEFFQAVIEKHQTRTFDVFPFNMDDVRNSADYPSYPNEKGLLSIIIPYYNLGNHLMETLQSALAVDYENYEVVIINDGSNDERSLEVLKEIEKLNLSNVRIVNIENGGLANARNVGAKAANGEFIAFLDADDLIDSTFYSRSIQVLNQYENVSFVYSWVQYFEGSDGVWPTFNTEFPYLLLANMLTAFVVVRRDDFLNFGQNRDIMAYGMEDFDGWVSMVAHGCYGVSIPETLVQYRVRANSMSRQFNRDMILYLYDQLSHAYPQMYAKYGTELLNLVAANGPGYLWNNPTWAHPEVGYLHESAPAPMPTTQNEELFRIANSEYGKKLINLVFKLKLNKLFK